VTVGNPEFILSTYLTSPGIRAFTCPRHDQAIALWRVEERRIVLQRYWELARYSGIKYHEMPLYAPGARVEPVIQDLLGEEGLSLDDVSEVWGTPGVSKYVRIPRLEGVDLAIHSLGHLFSGLFLDDERRRDSQIIAVALDGAPDLALEEDRRVSDNWYAGAIWRSGDMRLLPVESPGPLWLAAEGLFGLQPGTLMALATASSATVEFDVAPLLALNYTGGHQLITESRALMTGLARAAEAQIDAGHGPKPGEDAGPFSRHELVASAVMKVLHQVSAEIAKRSVDWLITASGFDPAETYLSLSGGFALNCPTNSYLLSHFGFKGLIAPPCADDGGQALGIGMLGFLARGMLGDRRVEIGLPYKGSDRLEVPAARSRWDAQIADVREFDEATFVRDIQAGPVAWVDGAGEVGPRALGHRSILADPRHIEAKNLLNEMRRREWWRPVAPVVLEEFTGDWFVDARRSPLMLQNFQIRDECLPRIPAVAHLDGSARIQTLTRDDEPHLHRALSAFFEATGVPMLCNTSLNDRGEPIVVSASEAINFCVRKGVQVAYIDMQRYEFTVDAAAGAPQGPEERRFAKLYHLQDSRPDVLFDKCMGADVLFLLFVSPSMHSLLETPGGEARLRSAARLLAAQDPGYRERALRFLEFRKHVPQSYGTDMAREPVSAD
jgi:carbamoyltransferase